MRSFVSAATAWIAGLVMEHGVLLVELTDVETSSSDSTPLRFTTYRKAMTWDGLTWHRTINGCGIEAAREFEESALLEAPEATLVFASVDADMQARFLADEFRGSRAQVTAILASQIGTSAYAWQTSYAVSADGSGYRQVTMTLGSPDAVQGTEIPRRQTHEHGCQWVYKRGGCPYRGTLATCERTIEDCRRHFAEIPAASSPSGAAIRQPLPYGAFPGGVPHRLVV